MKYLIFLLSFILLFSSCKKEVKKYSVTYKVIVISGHPSYSVNYSSLNNTTKTEGPMTGSSWASPTIDDREDGSTVSLTLEGGSGGSYNMYIYVNGTLAQDARMDDPYGPKTISVKLSD